MNSNTLNNVGDKGLAGKANNQMARDLAGGMRGGLGRRVPALDGGDGRGHGGFERDGVRRGARQVLLRDEDLTRKAMGWARSLKNESRIQDCLHAGLCTDLACPQRRN